MLTNSQGQFCLSLQNRSSPQRNLENKDGIVWKGTPGHKREEATALSIQSSRFVIFFNAMRKCKCGFRSRDSCFVVSLQQRQYVILLTFTSVSASQASPLKLMACKGVKKQHRPPSLPQICPLAMMHQRRYCCSQLVFVRLITVSENCRPPTARFQSL